MKIFVRSAIFFALFLFQFGCDSVLERDSNLDQRNRITGKYLLDEYSQTYNADFSYNIEILKSNGDNNEVYILNFYDSDIDVLAVIDDDKVFIPFQEKGNLEVEGVGTIYGNVIELNYSVFDLNENDSFPDFCTTVATKVK